MHLKHFYESTAFLYGELNETVYMQQQERFSDGSSSVQTNEKSIWT